MPETAVETETEVGTETASGATIEGIRRGGLREGQGYLGLIPHVQSKVARFTCAHNGKRLRRHFRGQEESAAKRAYVRITGPEEKGAMTLVECQGCTRFDTMEASL